MRSRSLFEVVLLASITMACGGSGAEAQTGKVAVEPPAPKLGKRRADVVDDCAQEPGKPAPEPLRIPYDGVAKRARCQREVYTIMGGLTHFLGVECKHCHLEPDYAADTHNKHVANWMAKELVPKLRQRGDNGQGAPIWCDDCHQGKPKILGNPRDRTFAIEWMTTHLVDDLEAASGKSLKCRQCHDGDLGSPQFRSKIILTELAGLPAPPPSAAGPAAPAPVAAPATVPQPAAAPSGSAAPVPDLPDYGAR
jgi:hypothetical protein